MTGVAILLLCFSSVLHASWNFISKSNSPSAAFLLVANTVDCVILVPVAVVFGVEYAAFPSSVWMLIIITGLFQALYYASLAGAYRSGDMSLAYPLARSSPVIVVTVVTFILGEGDTISLQCVVGIYLTYTLVLISMSWAKNVSYVVGFRQLSIPIGVMMGVFLLREPLYRPKAFGVVILLIGLVLIAV